MPNGQEGEGRFERVIMEQQRQRREIERRARYVPIPQEYYNNTVNSSFTVSGDWLDPGQLYYESAFIRSTPKPKRPKRPVSAIFYPMVNECGY